VTPAINTSKHFQVDKRYKLTDSRRKTDSKLVEFNTLSSQQKWQYLQSYWSKANEFYECRQGRVISDNEIQIQIAKLKEKPRSKIRRVIELKEWKWKLDAEMAGIREGYFKRDHDDKEWSTATVPHNLSYSPPDPVEFGTVDTPWYNFPSPNKPTPIYLGKYALWYRASVPLTRKGLEGKRAFIKFESCSIKTTAWVDEWPVILDHFGVYPFEAEVTEELAKSRHDDKQLSIQVVSTPSNTPDIFYNGYEDAFAEKRGNQDFERHPSLNWAGLNGAVELILTSPTYIRDLFIFTKKIREGQANLHVRLEIENTTSDLFEGKIILTVKAWYPQETSREDEVTLDVYARPLSTTVVEKEVVLRNPILWESWSPHLYLAHAILMEGGRVCDDIYESFGVRTFTARQGNFYLNNRRILLSATHDQGLYPDTSPTCPPDDRIVEDYLLHKALGMVAARYPSDARTHYRRIADIADQVGIMLIWEGYCSVWSQSPHIEELAKRDIPRMVRDLRNHPSIIVWVLGDETFYYAPSDPAQNTYQNKRSHYVELVHELVTNNDQSRLIVPVGGWAEDLTIMIESFVGKGLSVDDARKRSLELMPIFRSPNVYWNLHRQPSGVETEPVHAALERYRKILCGTDKPVTFDEFGCEGMPNWDLCAGEWWYKHWTISPFLPGGKKFIEPALIGRELSADDWQISQAYEASVNWRVLSYIRENKAFAGFSVVVLRDALTLYQGLVDARGRGKLAFFLLKNILGRFFISAMHGNYLFKRDEQLVITASNNGLTLKDASLRIKVTNGDGKVMDEKTIDHLTLGVGLSHIANYALSKLSSDLYAVEYYLQDQNDKEIGRSLDMFYVE